jgi:hypothetical protein
MKPRDEILACPQCGLRFHAECWAENRGCSAYGCAQVGALDVSGSVDADSLPIAEDVNTDEASARPLDSILSVARGWRLRSRSKVSGQGGSES